MTDILISIALGLIEGVTEMLPISSTGHLIIANQWLAFDPDFTKLFDIVIQSGAILAVLAYFWRTVSPFGRSPEDLKSVFRLWSLVTVAILPVLAIGYLMGSEILDRLFSPLIVATALILGAGLIIVADRQGATAHPDRPLATLSYPQALFAGLAQVLGLIPGMSRSASATIGGMSAGLSRKNASELSMLMAIPTLSAATLYSILKYSGEVTLVEAAILAVGFLVSWASCALVVRWFFGFIARHSLRWFALYRIALGILVILLVR